MRSFNPSDFVALPRYSASGAVALGASLLSAYKEEKSSDLPKSVVASAKRLFGSYEALESDFTQHIIDTAPVTDELRQTDTDVDGCWVSLQTLLSSYSRLPAQGKDQDLKAKAREIQSVVFPDGLKFILLPYKLEWAESQGRLNIIDERGYAGDIEALGGKMILATLRRTHQKYGDLQGLSKVSAPERIVDLRGKLDTFSNELREYIVKVSATVDRDVDGSDQLAARLLAPVAKWQSTATNGSSAGEDAAAPDAGAVTASPTSTTPVVGNAQASSSPNAASVAPAVPVPQTMPTVGSTPVVPANGATPTTTPHA